MVQAMIKISKKTNQVLNIVKARHDFKDKSQAIDFITLKYAETLLEPELKPEFIETMRKISKEKSIPVVDFQKRYGLDV